jgi:predicted CopG family antitoxin
MDSGVEVIQQQIKTLLSFQSSVPKPSAEICNLIANMKDLIELQASIQSDWRRASPEPGSPYRFNPTDARRPSNRSADSTPIARIPSAKSFGSLDSPGSPPPPVPKYQSKFKNSTQPVEDKILNNIILSKLNKFSPITYNEIRDFLYQILGSGEPDLQELIRDFILLVFKKAAIEETFCALYAKLLSEISGRYSIILTEMHALQKNYLTIFDDIQDPTTRDYDVFVEAQKEKRYRRGYSQFIAELIALDILNIDLLKSTFQLILTNMITFGKLDDKKTLLEEYSDCLLRMTKVLKKKNNAFFVNARKVLYDESATNINEIITNHANYPSVSVKTKFMMMDVLENLRPS